MGFVDEMLLPGAGGCLGAATFEPEEAGDFVLLAGHPLLPQLESLTLRELVIGDTGEDRAPLDVLTDLAPRFARLRLRVEGDIEIEGADEQEPEWVLAGLGLGREADTDDVE